MYTSRLINSFSSSSDLFRLASLRSPRTATFISVEALAKRRGEKQCTAARKSMQAVEQLANRSLNQPTQNSPIQSNIPTNPLLHRADRWVGPPSKTLQLTVLLPRTWSIGTYYVVACGGTSDNHTPVRQCCVAQGVIIFASAHMPPSRLFALTIGPAQHDAKLWMLCTAARKPGRPGWKRGDRRTDKQRAVTQQQGRTRPAALTGQTTINVPALALLLQRLRWLPEGGGEDGLVPQTAKQLGQRTDPTRGSLSNQSEAWCGPLGRKKRNNLGQVFTMYKHYAYGKKVAWSRAILCIGECDKRETLFSSRPHRSFRCFVSTEQTRPSGDDEACS